MRGMRLVADNHPAFGCLLAILPILPVLFSTPPWSCFPTVLTVLVAAVVVPVIIF